MINKNAETKLHTHIEAVYGTMSATIVYSPYKECDYEYTAALAANA